MSFSRGRTYLSALCVQANYSFSGALSPLSKLIICAVMIRGRHRGLPVAIDRAVLLPSEFKRQEPPPLEEEEYVDVADESVVGERTAPGDAGTRRSSFVPDPHRKATV